jgi:hypothetical protein
MANKRKPKSAPHLTAGSEPLQNLYIIRANDVEGFDSFEDDEKQIACIRLKRSGRIIRIGSDKEGQKTLASTMRRTFNEKVTPLLEPEKKESS